MKQTTNPSNRKVAVMRSILPPKIQPSNCQSQTFETSEQTDIASSHSSSKLNDYERVTQIGAGALC
jgi:hypothetical protein